MEKINLVKTMPGKLFILFIYFFRFECNICLDVAKDAVVSMCGHLFCWPCLHQWLETRPNQQLCPVCKSAISSEKVIPLYGRGGNDSDPRQKVPPRPRGQRTEEPNHSFPNFHWGGEGGQGGVQFSLGIGVFPLAFMASIFNANVGGERRADPRKFYGIFMLNFLRVVLDQGLSYWLVYMQAIFFAKALRRQTFSLL